MEIKWLEDFVSLARTRNFSRSSEERNVTQPAFSRRIRALENWIGTDLIDRRTYPIQLTEEGRLFRDTAETVLHDIYRDRAQFHQLQHAARPDIRIAAASTLSISFIPAWLKEIQQSIGPFTSNIMTENFHDMVRHLADGDIDFVLQYCSPSVPVLFDTTQFRALTLAREKMILVAPCDANGDPVAHPGQSGPVPYVGYSKNGYFSEIESLIFGENPGTAKRLKRISESPTSEFVKRMAIEFEALTLVPESCAKAELNRKELVQIDAPNWTHELDIQIYRKSDTKRLITRKLWETLTES
ncbi:LysR family transcriptional regulator [Thalassospira sp. UBA1131]|uniref:LysR family transcriptional regulator n=1 Tax=Thalassospira sp. UBA1131 TaxID=1947672 RepID=UPI0025F37261|nr:LysR substrate-binding domain-containing protein [Thalassospira sp. UBA1131]